MVQRQDGRIEVLPLAAATDYRVAGRKAATLARLAARGFPVPLGLVLPAVAPGVEHEFEISVPQAVDLLAAVRQWGDVPLAVRSSGVDEDGADASYAGLFTSVLHVQGDDALRAAVGTCWRSAAGARVTTYAQEKGDQPGRREGPGRLAVLIQPMVAASAAGVAFTADPVTGERDCVVIDAVAGIGERLVSGVVTPERWLVRGDTVHRRSADEPVRDSPALDGAVPDGPVLDEALARSVADLARRVEAELGGPQDVEWAIDDGEVVLLQARPVTALPAEPVPIEVRVPPGFWTREGSHAPTPWLPFSRAIAQLRNASLREVVISAGLLFDGLEFRQIGGWDYVRMIPLEGRQPPKPPGWLAPLASLLTPLVLRFAPAARRRNRMAVATVRSDRAGEIMRRWPDEWRPDFETRIQKLRDRRLDTLPDPALVEHLDDVLTLTAEGSDVHFQLHGALALILGELALTCRDLLGWDDARLMASLSGTSTASAGPALALAEVAALAGPSVRELLAQGAPVDRALAADAAFASAFEAYLTEYGCRTLSYELAEPSLEERPDLVLGLIRDQLDGGFDAGVRDELARRRQAEVQAAYQVLRGPDRARFERAWTRARRAYPVREDNEFYTVSAPFALLRRAALEFGRRLAERGQLAGVDDVFFLLPDEARARLADGTGAHPVVTRRKGQRSWALAHPGPASYGEDPGPPPSLRGLPAEARLVNEAFMWTYDRIFGPSTGGRASGRVLTGVAASGGRYRGPVRVIRSEAEFGRLRFGDVLVCPVTSPVWSVLFPSVGALVTDHGGTLSHSAIIAREYGVPAVVATRIGTERLCDGQLVAVDGTAGTVEVLEPPQAAPVLHVV